MCKFKYFFPSTAYIHHWTGPSLLQIMACYLFGSKQLPKPMMTSHQSHPKLQDSNEKMIKIIQFPLHLKLSFVILSPFLSRGRWNHFYLSLSEGITVLLWRKSTSDRWIHFTKGQYCKALVFSVRLTWTCCWRNKHLPVIWDAIMLIWHQCNVDWPWVRNISI